jgi:hypothetical protein
MVFKYFVSKRNDIDVTTLTVVGVIGNIVVILSDFVFHKITIILSLVIAGLP